LKWGQFPLPVPNLSGDRSLRSLRGEFGGGAEERFQGSQGGAGLRVEVLEDQVFGRYIQQKMGGNMSYLIIYIYILYIYIYIVIFKWIVG
jgi:hypothetical protein